MISALFIRRPILATVISIIIVLAGLASMFTLPIAQYPDILPPQISVSATYPGASAEVVSATVSSPLEQQINGATGLIYMTSTSGSTGSAGINVTFATGTNPDEALVEVNNRVQEAVPLLPEEVRRLGISVRKSTTNILGVVAMTSPDGRYDEVYVSNYALINVVDEIKRIPGVGNAQLFGGKYYAMRVWLDPKRMTALGLTPNDVATALRSQNVQLPAGRIGSEPLDHPVDFTFTMTTRGRLETPEEFGNVVVRQGADGAIVRVRDIARVELGAQDYSFTARVNGRVGVPIGIFLAPGANALQTMQAIRHRMDELAASFPTGIAYQVPYDTTKFVRISIKEVIETLFIAFALVFCVVYLFLGNWRATLIPTLAVPVSLIGAFAGMKLLGFSINTLTLFGMVLAIGIVVDDAIVVLENVERIMREEKLHAREATLKAMEQVTGPIIAIVLVLVSVFVPVAFITGLAGVMYRQFAITIAVSVTISGFVALTLTPALCSVFLEQAHRQEHGWLQRFNRFFKLETERYTTAVNYLIAHRRLTIGLFLGAILCALLLFRAVPGALVPDEDQGLVIAAAFLPDAASLSRSVAVAQKLDDFSSHDPLVVNSVTLVGFDLLTQSLKTNAVTKFMELRDWSERKSKDQSSASFAMKVMGVGSAIRDAFVLGINMPPIQGLSTTGGFEMFLQSRQNADYKQIAGVAAQLIEAANKDPRVTGVQTRFSANTPQIHLDIDRDKAAQMGVSLTDLFAATQSTFGTLYVNDFNRQGRVFQVVMQAQGDARDRIDALRNVYVRSGSSDLVPLTTLVTPVQETGPENVQRFNGFPAIEIVGNPAPGKSSGAALLAMEETAAKVLPAGYTIAWIGESFQEKEASGTAVIAFGAGILMVFLILSALYERWSLPVAVILAVPFAVFGAAAAVLIRGLTNDIYFQVGLVTLIGLSAKNAILIVEFAAYNVRDGMAPREAALAAARQRFRPIIMTSLSFIFGMSPLFFSSGAGSAARHSIGTGVIGGMLMATFVATVFIPSFFLWITRGRRSTVTRAPEPAATPSGGA